MNRILPAALTAAALAAPSAATALPWFDDMRDQPSENTQQSLVEMPDGTVPVDGGETLRPPRDISELVLARLDAAAIPNPVEADADSVARGRVIYETHCLACHGGQGRGDGPVGRKYVPPPMDLTFDYVRNHADGRLYYTITHGGVVMPPYRQAIDPQDRWHLVNYIKKVIAER